ncbi:MAG: hypothetical protein MZV65_44650 [Chromatiales bacterium]|nr:hypothetical protein [Chromatiales bacterium]
MFFVTNGTSTVEQDRVALRRWRRATSWWSTATATSRVLHAIIMTGAIPVFLMPTRNHYGIIGPIPLDEFQPESDPAARSTPTRSRAGAKRKPRVLTHHAEHLRRHRSTTSRRSRSMLDGRIDTLHFDEAWLPHAAFHDFYRDMHAIGSGPAAQPSDSMVFATQSTHKLLAGLSQASQILVQDSRDAQARPLPCFNEAYLMHTSTSPQYAIIASLRRGGGDDGAARRHRRWSRSRSPRRSTSAAPCARSTTSSASRWWFKVWGPEHLAEEGIGDARGLDAEAPATRWHGFGNLAPGFNMLDPIKATVITPGLDVDGDFAEPGIPAAIVTKYLAEHGIIVEKTGLYSFFIMFTIGITKGRWNTLVTELQQFKDDYDHNQPLWRVLPEFIAGTSALREDRPARPVRRRSTASTRRTTSRG